MTLPRGPNGHGVYTVISRRPPSDYAYTNGLNAPVSQPRFPHIKDLQAKANPGQGFNPYTPVSKFATVLLSCAHNTDVFIPADTNTFRASTAVGKPGEREHKLWQTRPCVCRVPPELEYSSRDYPTAQGFPFAEFGPGRMAYDIQKSLQGW